MANWDILKKEISGAIKTNGNQEITSKLLQQVLLNIVTSVGANATFAGIATPITNPGTPDGPVFYFAFEPGTYVNFSGITVTGEALILTWNNNTWSSTQLGFASANYVREEFAKTPCISSTSDADFELADENGNVILRLSGGNIQTKNFNSAEVENGVSGSGGSLIQSDFKAYHAIGDSITAGQGASNAQYFTHLKTRCGFMTVTSDGVGGREILSGFKSALLNIPVTADCVSFFGGTNDWGHHKTLGTMNDTEDSTSFYGVLKYICQWMATNRPTTAFFFITPIQRNCDKWPADSMAEGTLTNNLGLKLGAYVDAIKNVCAFYSVPCLDLFTTCFNGHNSEIVNRYIPDGLHPNPAGHLIMARKIAKFINFKL